MQSSLTRHVTGFTRVANLRYSVRSTALLGTPTVLLGTSMVLLRCGVKLLVSEVRLTRHRSNVTPLMRNGLDDAGCVARESRSSSKVLRCIAMIFESWFYKFERMPRALLHPSQSYCGVSYDLRRLPKTISSAPHLPNERGLLSLMQGYSSLVEALIRRNCDV